MTIQECQEQHKKLWNWIADETERTGKPVSKDEYFKAMGIPKEPLFDCFACEYCHIQNNAKCEKCPIDWKKTNTSYSVKDWPHCKKSPSPYRKWATLFADTIMYGGKNVCTDPIKELVKLAREIANLPFKEDECNV